MEYQPKLNEKNALYGHIVSYVLKILLIKIYKLQPPVILFFIVLHYAFVINQASNVTPLQPIMLCLLPIRYFDYTFFH